MRSLPAAIFFAVAAATAQEPAPATGVWAGPGADPDDAAQLVAALHSAALPCRAVSGAAELEGLRVVVVGAGSGRALARGLGAEGCAALGSFVARGGGYVGCGGGAWLAARGYDADTRQLELVDAALVDRGGERSGEVTLALVAGSPLPSELPERWRCSGAPLFTPGRSLGRAPYQAWARFASDLHEEDRGRAGLMPACDAIVAAPHGAGRAVLFAVLPQRTSGGLPALAQAVRWAAGEGDAVAVEPPATPPGTVRVAVLDDGGCDEGCVRASLRCLDEEPGFAPWRVSGADVRAGLLDQVDAVLLPGGSATGQSGALEPAGRERLLRFVAGGGGYVGVCAGAYLAACEPVRYGLGLLPVRCVDTKHWKRGSGTVELETAGAFAELHPGAGERIRMRYFNGPLLEAIPRDDLPAAETLLVFRSDVHENGAPAGVMPGKLAALRGQYREGRVIAFSTHPELTSGMAELLRRAVRWSVSR